jgi:hypothetical protein
MGIGARGEVAYPIALDQRGDERVEVSDRGAFEYLAESAIFTDDSGAGSLWLWDVSR